MTFEAAQRLTEVLVALAVLQQALEHLVIPKRDRWWFVAQVLLALVVADGVAPVVSIGALLVASLAAIDHFRGPYNGGSDRMRVLVLACLWFSHVAPTPDWQRIALGYLAVQVVLSYVVAGYVKLANPAWRRGQALSDVFAFSAYPVSNQLRSWATATQPLHILSWVLMVFEVAFPLALAHHTVLIGALAAALLFHLGNAFVFGLNRFVWIWMSAYPSLLWFQQELITRVF